MADTQVMVALLRQVLGEAIGLGGVPTHGRLRND
jgi:hypothetical protein